MDAVAVFDAAVAFFDKFFADEDDRRRIEYSDDAVAVFDAVDVECTDYNGVAEDEVGDVDCYGVRCSRGDFVVVVVVGTLVVEKNGEKRLFVFASDRRRRRGNVCGCR